MYNNRLKKRIWNYKSDALTKILEGFYATVRMKYGWDYEHDIFPVVTTAVDRC